MGAAGYELVAGPEKAAGPAEIEALVGASDPVAIMTCWGQVTPDAIAAPSRLALVARLGVGLDNIAVSAATERGAWVSNVPDYCVGEVSDHAIGLLLAHFRGIARLDAVTKAAGWKPDGSRLERVADLTIGIIGYGRIGRETARKLKAFGCRVLTVARDSQPNDGIAEPVCLATLQAETDVIILHVPLTRETSGMVNDAFLAACRRSPLLINVSRGGLVDNDALERALDAGLVRGAALDVVDGEPTPPPSVLARSDVIVTPHIAFASTASMLELRRRACEEVVRVLRGEAPLHPCNQPAGTTGGARSTPMEGGVSSDIRLVETPQGMIVVKQALSKLRVAAEWFSDPARSATEVAAIDAFGALLDPGSVPEVLWVRPEENSFAMRLVDPRLRNWKKDLLAGTIDPATSAAAARLLGLAHARSAVRDDLRQRFADTTYFHELRIEPFFLRVAERVPQHRDIVLATVAEIAGRRTALVHGDYSPKNILAAGAEVVILDFEVAHWGDPHFDLGFCLSHLLLKGLRRQADAGAFIGLIETFLDAYGSNGPAIDDRHLCHVVGCLLLARFEGRSPVDYLADLNPARARELAAALLGGTVAEFHDSLDFLRS